MGEHKGPDPFLYSRQFWRAFPAAEFPMGSAEALQQLHHNSVSPTLRRAVPRSTPNKILGIKEKPESNSS